MASEFLFSLDWDLVEDGWADWTDTGMDGSHDMVGWMDGVEF